MNCFGSPYILSGRISGGHRLLWSKENLLAILTHQNLTFFDADALLLSVIKPIYLRQLSERTPFLPTRPPCILNYPSDGDQEILDSTFPFPYKICFGFCKNSRIDHHSDTVFSLFTCGATDTSGESENSGVKVQALEKKKTNSCTSLAFINSLQRYLALTKRLNLFLWGPSLRLESSKTPFVLFLWGDSQGSLIQLCCFNRDDKKAFLLADLRQGLFEAYNNWTRERKKKLVIHRASTWSDCQKSLGTQVSPQGSVLPIIRWEASGEMVLQSFFEWIETFFGDIEHFSPASSLCISELLLGGYVFVIAYPRVFTFWWLQEQHSLTPKVTLALVGAIQVPQRVTEDLVTCCCFSPVMLMEPTSASIFLYFGTGYGYIFAMTLRLSKKATDILSITLVSVQLIENVRISISAFCLTPSKVVLPHNLFWYLAVAAGNHLKVFGINVCSTSLKADYSSFNGQSTLAVHQRTIMGLGFQDMNMVDEKFQTVLMSIDVKGCRSVLHLETQQHQQQLLPVMTHQSIFPPLNDCITLSTDGASFSNTLGLCEGDGTPFSENSSTPSTNTMKKGTLSNVQGLSISPNGLFYCIVEELTNVYQSDLTGDTLRLLLFHSFPYDMVKMIFRDLFNICFHPCLKLLQDLKEVENIGQTDIMSFLQHKIKNMMNPQSLHWLPLKIFVKDLASKRSFNEEDFPEKDRLNSPYRNLKQMMKRKSETSNTLPQELSPIASQFIKQIQPFQSDFTCLQSSSIKNFSRDVFFYIFHFLDVFTQVHTSPHSRTTILENLCEQLKLCFIGILEALDGLSLHIKSVMERYVQCQLARCLIALWFLLQPLFVQSLNSDHEVESQLKSFWIEGYLRLWNAYLLQPVSPTHSSYVVHEKFLASASMCLKTRTPLTSICPYCNMSATCPPPYSTFQCNQKKTIQHCTPISFLTLLPCDTRSTALWNCSLCNHFFQLDHPNSTNPIFVPFLDDLPQRCPLCFGQTYTLTY